MALKASCAQAHRLVATLEPTEHRVLARIAEGYSLAAAAAVLGVSLDDAVQAKASLMKKLGATMTADLVRLGIYAQVHEVH